MTYSNLDDGQLLSLHYLGIPAPFYAQHQIEVNRLKSGFIEVKTWSEHETGTDYKTVFAAISGQVEVLFQNTMIVHPNIWKFIKQCQEWGVDYD